MASDVYTPQQLADMARRLDECIEVSALCMELALASWQCQRTLADPCKPEAAQAAGNSDAKSAKPGSE